MRIAPLITCLALAAAALAEPFNPAYIGASARWVAHLDVDRVREAPGLQRLLAREDDPEARARAAEYLSRLGVDASSLEPTDFSFICAYGDGDGHDVAIIGGSQGFADWFTEWMNRAGQARPDQQREQWTIRSWIHKGEPTAMTTLPLPGERIALVIASSPDEVVAGAQVMTGLAASLAEAAEPLLQARPSPGAIFFIAARQLDDFTELRPRAVALRETISLVFEAGESADALFISANLTTTGPEQASALRDMLNGMRAWGRMASKQWKRGRVVGEMLGRIEMRVEEADLHISWRAAIESLLPPHEDDRASPP